MDTLGDEVEQIRRDFDDALNAIVQPEPEPEPEPEAEPVKDKDNEIEALKAELKESKDAVRERDGKIEDLKGELKNSTEACRKLFEIKRDYEAIIDKQMSMIKYMGEKAKNCVGLRFDEMEQLFG